MRFIEINGNKPLYGEVDVPGSKNSALGLLAAACLSSEEVILKNMPNISDIDMLLSIEEDIGVEYIKNIGTIKINPRGIYTGIINKEKSEQYRASYYFVGALLQKMKKVRIGYPGGDNFGSRPIDQHIKGFKALGAKVETYKDYYEVSCDSLKGANIYFDVITCGATINVMLAAVLAKGKTVLKNAAKDPEVVDVAIMLNEMGAKIKGMGTSTIVINGVEYLGTCNHTVIPDRLIAGSLIIAAGATRGDVTVRGVIPEHLLSCIAKLSEAGVSIECGDDYLRAYVSGKVLGVNVKTSMYPGFATDLQQPLTSLLLTAEKNSSIVDNVYPERFNHCIELNKMGANIILKEGSIVIPGKRNIFGAKVHATDVRAGMSLILAGLIAKGKTEITGVEHIERGYPNIVSMFKSLGADMNLIHEEFIKIENALMEVNM